MRRFGWAILAAAVLLASSSSVRAADWQRVTSWSGTGIRDTETFTITGTQWQIGWSGQSTSQGGSGYFGVMIYQEDGTLAGVAANQLGRDGIGGTSIQRQPGNYYLSINSANVQWAVTIDEFR